jgi:hypothetical protein
MGSSRSGKRSRKALDSPYGLRQGPLCQNDIAAGQSEFAKNLSQVDFFDAPLVLLTLGRIDTACNRPARINQRGFHMVLTSGMSGKQENKKPQTA